MTRVDPILILLFAGVLALFIYQSCGTVTDRENNKDQLQMLRDSIASLDSKVSQLYTKQNHLYKLIDSLKVQKVKIITKYEPIKESIRNAPGDSLASIVRSRLDTVLSR